MEAAVQQQEIDALATLEERITRAVQAITRLRSENGQLQDRLSATESDLNSTRQGRDEAQALSAELQRENAELHNGLKRANDELDGLRGERQQVKERIERLLGQLDLVSAS